MHLGQYAKARVYAQQAIDLGGGTWFDVVLGCVALVEGAHSEARRLLGQSVAGFVKQGWRCVVLVYLAYAECALDDLCRAEEHLHEVLQTSTEVQAFWPIVAALPAVALLLSGGGQLERAVEIYALASRYPQVANSRWFEDVAGKHIAAAAVALPPEVVDAAQKRGRARDLWGTAEELLAKSRWGLWECQDG
jgi:hypothetical protein